MAVVFLQTEIKNTETMEITGTIYKILPTEEVVLGDGTKRMKGGFVILRGDEYAKPVAFELFGEERLALLYGCGFGMPVMVSFTAASFETKKGGYYTTLRCTNIMPLAGASAKTNYPGTTASGNAYDTVNNNTATGGGQWNPSSGVMSQDKPIDQLPPD